MTVSKAGLGSTRGLGSPGKGGGVYGGVALGVWEPGGGWSSSR